MQLELTDRCTSDAARLLTLFHHFNVDQVDARRADLPERRRQWRAVLERVDQLGAGNRNGRIYLETVDQAIAERWRLEILTPAPASPAAAPAAATAPIDAAAAWPALRFEADEGRYRVSIETPFGWVDVLHAQGLQVDQVAEPHAIGEAVQRAADLAGAAARTTAQEQPA